MNEEDETASWRAELKNWGLVIGLFIGSLLIWFNRPIGLTTDNSLPVLASIIGPAIAGMMAGIFIGNIIDDFSKKR